jgi:glycosyltransferase involved in cell wall biosynthesis
VVDVAPELSVVVASHDRPLRLRWLLNALEHQTLDRGLWEVVVCHDSSGSETDELLRTHPLTAAGTLIHTRLPAGTAPPGTNRNAALDLARAPTIVFTDDDCRPPPNWLVNVREAVRSHPDAIIQGPTWGDPDESALRESIYFRTQDMLQIPRPWAECCNIVYPRAAIERAGGFPEDMYTGEDTTLHVRALASGASYVGDARMLTYHAIEDVGLLGRIRDARRWHDLPQLYKRNPELREHLPLSVFWMRTHALLPAAVLGVRLAPRNSLAWLLVVPWAIQRQAMQPGARGRFRHLLQLPGWAAVDLAEMAVLIRGSVRHRSVLL